MNKGLHPSAIFEIYFTYKGKKKKKKKKKKKIKFGSGDIWI